MKTWFQWVPQHTGKWRESGPPCQTIIDERNRFEWEIWFVALDRPSDVAKLLSMEVSDAWLNEAREIPKPILDAMTGRVGRFPPMWQGGCVNPQILMDTNSPDTDHWWYILAERDTTNERNRQLIQSMNEAEELLRIKSVLRRDQRLMTFYSQPSGRSALAENTRNLRAGYYEFLMAGKDEDFIKVYVDGEYGFVMEGLAVYPEYKDSFHSKELALVTGVGLRVGADFGLTPAATFSQRLGNGRWLTLDEYVSERMGIKTFADEVVRFLGEKYPGVKVVSSRGDPSGDSVTPEESTCFKIMTSAGIPMEPAPTNDPTRRKEGMKFLLKQVVDGEPAWAVNKRCNFLRKGFKGGYHHRRIQVAGDVKYRDVPEKNIYSHVCEALEYDVVSAGEDRNVTVIPSYRGGPRADYAESDFEEFT